MVPFFVQKRITVLQAGLASGRYLSLQRCACASACRKKAQPVVEEFSNSTRKLGGCGFTNSKKKKKPTRKKRRALRYAARLGPGRGEVENRITGLDWMDASSPRFKQESAQNVFMPF